MTNRNPRTNIRYGVISGNSLDPEILNELFYGSGAVNVSFNDAYAEAKREFSAEYNDLVDQAEIAAAEVDANMSDRERERFIERWFEDNDHINDHDEFVDRKMERWNDHCEIEEPLIEGEYKGVKYAINWLGGAPIVYAVEGPLTYVRNCCSPCVPGAADLDSGFDPNGFLTYSVPQDWVYEHCGVKLFYSPPGPDQVVDGPSTEQA